MAGVTTNSRSLVYLLVCFLFAPQIAAGDVVITEIMYDLKSGSDSGREWIEIFNSGPEAVDVSKLKLFENGTHHKIAAASAMLSPGQYGVIAATPAKFQTDWQSFSAPLFDSAFALGNDGDALEIRTASSTVLDSISYSKSAGGAGDGNSLNRDPLLKGAFVPREPSPGAQMSTTALQPAQKVSPTKTKTATKKVPQSEQEGEVDARSEPVEDATTSVSMAAAVGVPETSSNSVLWWTSIAALGAAVCVAVFVGRRYSKNEWDIVEETGE